MIELRLMIREILEEALPPKKPGTLDLSPEVSKGEKRRYRADGTSVPDDSPDSTIPTTGTANTQMPPTQYPKTVPAKASNAERAMDQELKALGVGKTGQPDPNRIPRDKSAGSSKAALVHKILANKGVQANIDAVQKWIVQMDPMMSLIKTADDLANDWMSGTET